MIAPVPGRAQGQVGAPWAMEAVPAHGRDGTGSSLRSLASQAILWFCACEVNKLLTRVSSATSMCGTHLYVGTPGLTMGFLQYKRVFSFFSLLHYRMILKTKGAAF